MDFRSSCNTSSQWRHFCTIREFFNSEIIGYETQSTFGIKFIRDHFSAMDAVNATNIEIKDAYTAIATDQNLHHYWKFR
jgi:hypothetical protein